MAHISSARKLRAVRNILGFMLLVDYAYVLKSYGVKVAAIEYGTGTAVLFPDWDYGATTLRHVKEFLQQHGHTKMTKQEIIRRGKIINGNIVIER